MAMSDATFSGLAHVPVLVTGGAGFIGSHLVHRLVEVGALVLVMDNFCNGLRENLAGVAGKIGVLEGDIRNPEDCVLAARDRRVIFHLAALGSVPASVEKPRLFN